VSEDASDPHAQDVHALDPDEFRRRVRSFEHWFDAVEGYLGGLHNGHVELASEPIDDSTRERLVRALSTYWVGESAALEGTSGLVRIAPNSELKIFLATQVVDEARHLEVMRARIAELGADASDAAIERRAAPSLLEFRRRLLALVDSGDWTRALFAQNVMLESMEYVTFGAHAKTADPITRDVLERVLRDERRHLGFGENEIARALREAPEHAERIRSVKRELDGVVLATFEHAARELALVTTSGAELGRAYLQAVARLGLAA